MHLENFANYSFCVLSVLKGTLNGVGAISLYLKSSVSVTQSRVFTDFSLSFPEVAFLVKLTKKKRV